MYFNAIPILKKPLETASAYVIFMAEILRVVLDGLVIWIKLLEYNVNFCWHEIIIDEMSLFASTLNDISSLIFVKHC